MPVEICTVSGYTDVGRNMTAVKVDDEAVIFDMGLHIENYVSYTEDEDFVRVDMQELIANEAAPDIAGIKDWWRNVKAIVPSHAHLDHVGAIPYLAPSFNAPVICTPFTAAVLNNILHSEKIRIPNTILSVAIDGKRHISDRLAVELVNVTHSTPESSAIVLHTPHGAVVYMSDFKIDATPVVGKKMNLKRLEELGKEGVLALIIDSTNAQVTGKTPSEAVAKEMLKDVLSSVRGRDTGIIITTFSSHIARLKSALELGLRMNRKVVFMGRSMHRYISAAEQCGIARFSDKAEVLKYARQIERGLKNVMREGKEKYLLVVSGHQAEPKSTLSKIAGGLLKYMLDPRDYVIFSCRVIPTPTNIRNRVQLEKTLTKMGVHIFKDIHQSGHGASEDIKEVISLLKPKHIIPAHGTTAMRAAVVEIAAGIGYGPGHVHMMADGQRMRVA